jgi:hypothetical protein
MLSKTCGLTSTEVLERLTTAAWAGEALVARDAAQALSRHSLASVTAPKDMPPTQLAIAAALVELLAERTGQTSPSWTQGVGPLAEPWFLLRRAQSFPKLREMCLRESPEPLKKRRLYAPANYLTWA